LNARVVEANFLSKPFQSGMPVLNRVLVVGSDATGAQVVDRLVAEGFRVLLVGDGSAATESSEVTVLPDAKLEAVNGFAGDFEVQLATSEGLVRERVGFIVAAPPAERAPLFDAFGLAKSARVMSLSELESMLAEGTALEPRRGEWFHAAFLCGLTIEQGPRELERVLDAVEKLGPMGKVQPYVFTRNVKVAASGLERRYRSARERGTLFFKFDGEGPRFEDSPDGPLMVFTEPLLGIEMELLPDLVVVDEQVSPSTLLQPLLATIPSAPAYAPYLQPDSLRFAGVETPKKGILAVGASRGMTDPSVTCGDADAVVTWLKQFVHGPTLAEPAGPAEVDPAKCTICLTCVRLCPHGAITYHSAAEVDPNSCARCGICAVECPNRAITLAPAPGIADISAQVGASLDCSPSIKPKISAFLCSRSAAQAFERMPASIRRKVLPVVVPCAGALDPAHLLKAIEAGADGVLAAGCFTGNCASIYGTLLARERVQETSALLQQMGLNPATVDFVQMAGNAAGALEQAIVAMEARLTREEG
jgi:coenzyme F420-reducing hydrogenase delta subunit/ferredoxin